MYRPELRVLAFSGCSWACVGVAAKAARARATMAKNVRADDAKRAEMGL
jgi:hypothetical protein